MRIPRNLGLAFVIAACSATVPAIADSPAQQRFAATGSIAIAFTPDDRIDRLTVAAIDGARHEVLVLAYSFTGRSIARALVRARERGASVRVVADREQARALPQNVLQDLVTGGVDVALDGNFQAAHNQVIVIDAGSANPTTITGSYNYAYAAQRGNAENVVGLRDNATVAKAYRDNWLRLAARSTPWPGAAPP